MPALQDMDHVSNKLLRTYIKWATLSTRPRIYPPDHMAHYGSCSPVIEKWIEFQLRVEQYLVPDSRYMLPMP